MRTLNKYLTQDFLVTFGITLAVFTGVMCLGILKQAIDVAARGISMGIVAKVFALNFPFMLTFSIPMSLLTSVLLVFGRMSFDGEITAMKACGVSLWQIIAPILVISIVLSLFCLGINTELAPWCRWQYRSMIAKAGGIDPANLLEPGRFVRDFPGLMIYVSSREGDRINNVVVYELGPNGPVKHIRADYGTIRTDPTNAIMSVNLFNAHSDFLVRETNGDERWHHVDAAEQPYTVSLHQLLKKQQVTRKIGEMTYSQLIHGSQNVAELYPGMDAKDLLRQRTTMLVEANKRLVLSLSCFAFVLIGVPLGMKSKRKESSIGIGISLGLVFVFYLFILIASNLVGHARYHPDLIVWFPIIAAEILGFILIQKTN